MRLGNEKLIECFDNGSIEIDGRKHDTGKIIISTRQVRTRLRVTTATDMLARCE